MKEKLHKILIELHLINENTVKVWDALKLGDRYTYIELMETTGLSRSTLYDALYRLEKDDFIERITASKVVDSEGKAIQGRPKRLWKLSERGELIKS